MWLRTNNPIVLLGAIQTAITAQQTNVREAKKLPSHPTKVALVDEGDRGSVYRRFPSGQRPYSYNRDRPGQSVCNVGCAMAWLPVLAPNDAVTVGDWTTIVRQDGTRQWALKRKPVYTRFHEDPDMPETDGLYGTWHVVSYTAHPVNQLPRLYHDNGRKAGSKGRLRC